MVIAFITVHKGLLQPMSAGAWKKKKRSPYFGTQRQVSKSLK
jgi:hypothetical protein